MANILNLFIGIIIGLCLNFVIKIFHRINKQKKMVITRMRELRLLNITPIQQDLCTQSQHLCTDIAWFNVLLQRFFHVATRSYAFKEKMKENFLKKLQPLLKIKFIKNAEIVKVEFGVVCPVFKNAQIYGATEFTELTKKFNTVEFVADEQLHRQGQHDVFGNVHCVFDMEFDGKVEVVVRFYTVGDMTHEFLLVLRKFKGLIAYRLPARSHETRFEYSFLGDPHFDFSIDPLGNVDHIKKILMPALHQLFVYSLNNRLVYPSWASTYLPMVLPRLRNVTHCPSRLKMPYARKEFDEIKNNLKLYSEMDYKIVKSGVNYVKRRNQYFINEKDRIFRYDFLSKNTLHVLFKEMAVFKDVLTGFIGVKTIRNLGNGNSVVLIYFVDAVYQFIRMVEDDYVLFQCNDGVHFDFFIFKTCLKEVGNLAENKEDLSLEVKEELVSEVKKNKEGDKVVKNDEIDNLGKVYNIIVYNTIKKLKINESGMEKLAKKAKYDKKYEKQQSVVKSLIEYSISAKNYILGGGDSFVNKNKMHEIDLEMGIEYKEAVEIFANLMKKHRKFNESEFIIKIGVEDAINIFNKESVRMQLMVRVVKMIGSSSIKEEGVDKNKIVCLDSSSEEEYEKSVDSNSDIGTEMGLEKIESEMFKDDELKRLIEFKNGFKEVIYKNKEFNDKKTNESIKILGKESDAIHERNRGATILDDTKIYDKETDSNKNNDFKPHLITKSINNEIMSEKELPEKKLKEKKGLVEGRNKQNQIDVESEKNREIGFENNKTNQNLCDNKDSLIINFKKECGKSTFSENIRFSLLEDDDKKDIAVITLIEKNRIIDTVLGDENCTQIIEVQGNEESTNVKVKTMKELPQMRMTNFVKFLKLEAKQCNITKITEKSEVCVEKWTLKFDKKIECERGSVYVEINTTTNNLVGFGLSLNEASNVKIPRIDLIPKTINRFIISTRDGDSLLLKLRTKERLGIITEIKIQQLPSKYYSDMLIDANILLQPKSRIGFNFIGFCASNVFWRKDSNLAVKTFLNVNGCDVELTDLGMVVAKGEEFEFIAENEGKVENIVEMFCGLIYI